MPALREHVRRLSERFPSVAMKAASWPVGSASDYEAFCVGIDCVLRDAPRDQPDNVALVISVMHVTTEPSFVSADVTWGDPSGAIEAELSDLVSRPYTEGIADSVQDRLLNLVESLEFALQRGGPPPRSN